MRGRWTRLDSDKKDARIHCNIVHIVHISLLGTWEFFFYFAQINSPLQLTDLRFEGGVL